MKSRGSQIFSAVMVFCLMLSCIAGFSPAALGAEESDLKLIFALDKDTVVPGEEVTVTVSLSNYAGNEAINGIRGMQIDISFDPGMVEYVAGSAKVLLSTTQAFVPPSASYANNNVQFLYMGTAAQSLERGATELFSFKVRAKEIAASSEMKFIVDFKPSDRDNVRIPASFAAPSISIIIPPTFCDVNFNSNGGSSVASQSVEEGKTAMRPADPSREGYTFLGWFLNGSAYNFSTPVTGDITLTAQWEEIIIPPAFYNVNFNSNGGSAVTSQSVEEGKTATKPADPARTGYTFLGWFLNGSAYNFSTPVTGDITLVAQWEEIIIPPAFYNVNFNSNGGSAVTSQSVEEGKTAMRPADPSRTGYNFLGWFLNGSAYNFAATVTNNITLVAQWEEIVIPPTFYNVNFNSNGGSAVTSQSVEEGKTATKPADPARTGYTFLGWFLNGSAYNFATPVTGNITLVAQWEEIIIPPTYYNVNFNSNGGSSVTSQSVEEGKTALKPADPTRTGYNFLGWFLNGSAYNFATPVTGNITLTAQWEEIIIPPTFYNVNFNSNGGSSVASQSVETGKTAFKPADPTRTGYNFLGWFLNGSAYNFATPVTGNITLTAQWEEIIIPPATYTVTFVIDGVTVKTQTVEHGAAAQAPAAPAKAGWAFNGWDMSFSNITADLTVTAQWVESKAPGGNQNKFLPLYILAGLAAAAAVWFFAHRSLRSGKKA